MITCTPRVHCGGIVFTSLVPFISQTFEILQVFFFVLYKVLQLYFAMRKCIEPKNVLLVNQYKTHSVYQINPGFMFKSTTDLKLTHKTFLFVQYKFCFTHLILAWYVKTTLNIQTILFFFFKLIVCNEFSFQFPYLCNVLSAMAVCVLYFTLFCR